MNELVLNIIILFVGVAIFLVALRMMATGLRMCAGKGVRNLFSKTEDNRFANFGIGVATTAIIQSSDATSVMVIGFISAGAMTMFQGVCTILGAYVGTTVTGLIVALSSFSFSNYLMIFAFVGAILMFFKDDFVRNLGDALLGFGLLFFALMTMSTVCKKPEIIEPLGNFFKSIENIGISPLLFFIIGIGFTMITQSSSATSGIVIVLAGQGVISLPSAFFLVLGATIGSVTPTLLATIGGSADVKRTGLLCLFSKSIVAILTLAIVWPLQTPISEFFISVFGNKQLSVAIFMCTFSLVGMSILLIFAKPLVALSQKIIIDKDLEKKKKAIKYIDERLLRTPKVAMMQLKKEVFHMLDLSFESFKLGYHQIFSQDLSHKQDIIDGEDAIDFINAQITEFLIKLSPTVGRKDEKKIGAYFHMINDIERIGDHAYNFYETACKMAEEKLKFSATAEKECNELFDVISEMFHISFDIFESKRNLNELAHLHQIENRTDELKLELTAAHYTRISEGKCKVELSDYYSSFISELERIADHLVNIGYAFVNPTGDETKKELN